MLVFVSMLWATEAIPLFATSMLVTPLVVILRVMVDHTKSPPERMPAKDAAPAIFHSMFSQVQ
jgi:di/tricarboxylate transporter